MSWCQGICATCVFQFGNCTQCYNQGQSLIDSPGQQVEDQRTPIPHRGLGVPLNGQLESAQMAGVQVGLNTGIPWVGFSHTVPEPAHTVTHHGYTHTRTVIHAVLYGTFGTRCLFSLKYVRYIFICKYNY